MISDQLLSQIGLLLKEAVPPLIRVTDSPSSTAETPHWAPGDKLPATVLTNLPNGRFQVQVDSQTLELNLPKNTQPGEQLELVYVGNSPRLTFTLAAAPALPAAATPAGLPAAAELSETAHLLGQLSQQGSKAAQGVAAQAPVLGSPPTDASQLAVALARTLAGSGLFYESHQAQWVQGERPLAALQQEPQAQQAQGQQLQGQQAQGQQAQGQSLPPPGPGTSLPVMQPAAGPSVHGPQVQPGQSPLPQAQADWPLQAGGPVSHLAAPGMPTGPQALPAGLDPANAALLQQQLQLLESGTLQWSGPVWPGQQMEWEISGLPAGQGEEGQQWQTRLNLTLPGLGKVSAWLLLGQQGLQVRLQAEAEPTRQLLVASGATLDRALQSAGLSLTQYRVESHG